MVDAEGQGYKPQGTVNLSTLLRVDGGLAWARPICGRGASVRPGKQLVIMCIFATFIWGSTQVVEGNSLENYQA